MMVIRRLRLKKRVAPMQMRVDMEDIPQLGGLPIRRLSMTFIAGDGEMISSGPIRAEPVLAK
jgi:hypothetical protein